MCTSIHIDVHAHIHAIKDIWWMHVHTHTRTMIHTWILIGGTPTWKEVRSPWRVCWNMYDCGLWESLLHPLKPSGTCPEISALQGVHWKGLLAPDQHATHPMWLSLCLVFSWGPQLCGPLDSPWGNACSYKQCRGEKPEQLLQCVWLNCFLYQCSLVTLRKQRKLKLQSSFFFLIQFHSF